ncbi:MAG TPA: hypothetical protein VJX74_20015 [Blastocatellia bacterium]|nr:hypothetical protein [Blastocatellia bacterium]
MPKRKHINEDELDTDDYADAECPECGAIITARFQHGRRSRRLRCPVCEATVTISLEAEEPEQQLIQIRRPDEN